MDENFNIEEFFKNLKPEVFNSLSETEQDEILDTLVEIFTNDEIRKRVGEQKFFLFGNNKGTTVDPKDIIDNMGVETFKELMRKSIMAGALDVAKITKEELDGIVDRLKNNNLTEEDKTFLNAFVPECNSDNNVNFSTFMYLHVIADLLEKVYPNQEKDSKDKLVKDISPILQAAYVYAIASMISNKNTTVSKAFFKHGMFQLDSTIKTVMSELTDKIISYGEETGTNPEIVSLALIEIARMIMTGLGLKLSIENDRTEEYLKAVFASILFHDETEEKCIKDVIEGIRTTESNGSNKNDNTTDLRSLLLDD